MEDGLHAPLTPRSAVEIRSMTQPAPETQDFDDAAIAAALSRMGLLPPGQKPRGEQLWEAPVRRNFHEWNWFKVAGRICPDAVPPLVGQDASAGLFVMDYLDPALFPVWKEQLRDGNADLATAEAVATRLVMIHNATAGD